ncbi:MAG: vitamin B12 dependent-methionine synthase activation domain-containing protein [Bacteroides sp.]|nr:vitamin B12 dependent-methionine synthase activation domain-containing protein [Bacteroides sp.]
MSYTILDIEKTAISPDQADLLSHLSGNGEELDEHTLNLTTQLIAECQEIMEPKGGFVLKDALPTGNPEDISIPGTNFHTGKTIVKMLKGARQYVFFMATAGPEPEKLAKTLIAEGQYLEGYIVDLIASSLAETAAQYVHDYLKELLAQKDFKITNRYSPGYCGWKVDEQQKLFSLFPEGSCGITLSESSLMFPIKSVSGVVGAGPEVSFRDYTCELCSMKDCSFRKTRHTNR